jgi:hypothetical protein
LHLKRTHWPDGGLMETAAEFLLAVGVIFQLHSAPSFDERETDD